jgi:glycerophosphoryl diester phosphodiesterase
MTTLTLALLTSMSLSSDTAQTAAEPVLFAHRGLMAAAPENTLPAFAAAIELGFSLEVDVWQTRDGQLVVIHDPSANRTTNGKGPIAQMTLEQVRSLDAGSWFHPAFAGTRVPTLEEVFRLVKDRRRTPTVIALHVKKLGPGGEEKVARLVEQYDLFDSLYAFDLSTDSAARFRKATPRVKTCGSVAKREQFKAYLENPAYDDLWLHALPTAEEVAAAHAKGKRVWLWDWAMPIGQKLWDYCNEARKAGIDGICTNHPIEVREQWMPKPKAR